MSAPTLLAGFIKWETGGGDVRLCDGGTLTFDGDTYTSRHPVFGGISGFEPISEGIGDEAPAGTLTFSPAPDALPAAISAPTLQGTRLRMWIAEVDRETGLIIGSPDLQLDNIADVTRLRLAKNVFQLAVDIVPRLERLFLLNEGNVLSGEFHRRMYPGERGLDNTIGVPVVVAWGVAGAPRGTSSGGGGSFGGGFDGITQARLNNETYV
jgi:hypothetical protein